MAVCLQYQAVYVRRKSASILSWKTYFVVGMVVLFSLALKVRGQIAIIGLGYELHGAQSDAMELDRERTDLEYQFSVLSTHQFLRAEGESRLRMRETQVSQIRHIARSE
jgi:hypothetical protein